MRVLLQRVAHASVRVDGSEVGRIGVGALLLVGVGRGDSESDALWLVRKVANLRVFSDVAGRMNLTISDVCGSFLAISQFTLFADCRKGNRPGFTGAEEPAGGRRLFDFFVDQLRALGHRVDTGIFGADMKVELLNNGPVTIMIDSREGRSAAGDEA